MSGWTGARPHMIVIDELSEQQTRMMGKTKRRSAMMQVERKRMELEAYLSEARKKEGV